MLDIDLHENDYPVLDLLKPNLELDRRNDGFWVKDAIRKTWLKLTPEEWVRQHAIFWLIEKAGFPAGLLSIERAFSAQSLKRADILGFGRTGNALLLVECKAAYELIDAETARQALQYNAKINAQFVWLTNGLSHRVLSIAKDGQSIQEPILPSFDQMISR